MHRFASHALRLAILAGGMTLAAPAAFAQDYGYGPPESVTVTAPRLDTEHTPLNGPLEKVSLSGSVPYSDLDLTTYDGARELRWRIREEARDVCQRLAEVYPVRRAPGTSCYREAVENGLVQADEAITTARQYARDQGGYYYGYSDH